MEEWNGVQYAPRPEAEMRSFSSRINISNGETGGEDKKQKHTVGIACCIGSYVQVPTVQSSSSVRIPGTRFLVELALELPEVWPKGS